MAFDLGLSQTAAQGNDSGDEMDDRVWLAAAIFFRVKTRNVSVSHSSGKAFEDAESRCEAPHHNSVLPASQKSYGSFASEKVIRKLGKIRINAQLDDPNAFFDKLPVPFLLLRYSPNSDE